MIALWDTTGNEVAKALSSERRSAGGLTSGLALTLVVAVDEKRVREAETAAATAAAAHPCRLLIVVRTFPTTPTTESRLDAEIVVGGRLGPAEAVVMRMHGRLALHAESVVMPLLAPDVPVVTWWHGGPPDEIATDPLGVVAERRITDVGQTANPVETLRRRAEDYAPGDTDLAWTRATPWRSLVASALDPVSATVIGARVVAPEASATGALLRGWLCARLGLLPELVPATSDVIENVVLKLSDGTQISIDRADGVAHLRRTGMSDRILPLIRRPLGDQLAEEMKHLDADQPYAAALSAVTGVHDLSSRPRARVHVWRDPVKV